MQQWTGCIAGALTRAEFESALAAAGLVDVEIRETHRVHEHAAAAIVRAVKPGSCVLLGERTRGVLRHVGKGRVLRRGQCGRAVALWLLGRVTRVGINGFGRMGRLALRAGWGGADLNFAHINEIAGDAATAAHLLDVRLASTVASSAT